MTQANLRLVEGTSVDKTKALDAALSQIERAFGNSISAVIAVSGGCITGYAVIGLVAGNAGFGVIDVSSAGLSRPLLDVALGLLLFELGSRLDLRWIRRNPYLILLASPRRRSRSASC